MSWGCQPIWFYRQNKRSEEPNNIKETNMKRIIAQLIAILLAAWMQIAPLLRNFVPDVEGFAPTAWGYILKICVTTAGVVGFDAISSASSISISPPTAIAGQSYVGTITYAGGHAGNVKSMTFSNNCMSSSISFFDGMSIVYSGGNYASVTGTPTSPTTNTFSIKVWDGANCPGSGENDTRSTTMIVLPSGGAQYAPNIVSSPPNTVAQVGSTVQLSGGASGNPLPQYQWWQGLTPIANATNNVLTLTNVQLSTAGIYTMTASNSQTVGGTFSTLPKANCYLSAAITGGTNFTAYLFTNYAPAGEALTMFSVVTNVSTSTNGYYWVFNYGTTISTSNTVPLAASVATPTRSGTYTVYLASTNSGGTIISPTPYDSYWAFGYLPVFTNSLPATNNVNAGTNVTFSIAVGGTLNVYNSGTGGGYQTNTGVPCVFWYQNNNLVATQSLVLGPTSNATYTNSTVMASMTLSNVTSANNGSYTVVATNFWGSVTSSPSVLIVGSSSFTPVITTNPPASLALLAGQNTAMSVTVTGTPPFSYQWRIAGTNLANGGVFSGVLTNILSLTGATTNISGNYTVVITNTVGAVTSTPPTVVNVAAPPTLGGTGTSQGGVQFGGNTITDLNYVVVQATNLSNPVWIPIQTNNTGPSGSINFQTNTAGNPNTFYRLQFP
jgi:hypothetical protein